MMEIYNLHQAEVEEFFATARERYEILLRRRKNLPAPWTQDAALGAWRFCNVFREDDRTTVWIREHIREPLRNDHRVFMAMILCRLFNLPANLDRLLGAGLLHKWDGAEARKVLGDVRPVVGCAYRVKTPPGRKKLEGVIWIADRAKEYATDFVTRTTPIDATLEAVWEKICCLPFFGPFMAYEVVSDLRHTYLLEHAPDVGTWANPGPGACAGLSWLVGRNFAVVPYRGGKVRRAAILTMQRLLALSRSPKLWPAEWPRWEMREVEHWLCEYAKWVKVTHCNMRMKRRYSCQR